MKRVTKWQYKTSADSVAVVNIEVSDGDSIDKIEDRIKEQLRPHLEYENKAWVIVSDFPVIPRNMLYSISDRLERNYQSRCDLCDRVLFVGEWIVISPTIQKTICHPCHVEKENELYRWLYAR